MAYIITKTNGQTLLTLQDGTLDTTKTSITLVGKNYPGYGTVLNQNLVRMLENFANSTSPSNPLVGQLWYSTATGRLNVYSGAGYKPHSPTIISATRPITNATGDFWFKSDTAQLYVYNGNDFDLIGPTVTNSNIQAADITASGNVTATNGIFTGNVDVTGTLTAGAIRMTATSGRVVYTTASGQLATEGGFEYDNGTDTLTVANINVTGVTTFNTTQFPVGAAATPSITTPLDTNTGIYFPALDTVGITVNGSLKTQVGTNGLRVYGSTAGFVGLNVQAYAGSTTYTFPMSDGLSGYALTTNGSGSMSWSANPGFLGSRGPQGFTGSGGFTGSASTVAGPSGPQGTVGFTGSSGGGGGGGGYTGSVGSQGPQGFTGSRSTVAGPQGFTGSIGGTGFTGSQGTPVTFASNSTNTNRYVLFTDNTVSPLTNIYYNSSFVVNPSTGTVTATDFAATSDIRFKDISGPVTNALAKVNKLRGVHYKWNETAKLNGMIDTSEQVGVIAQEVEQVLPQAVETYQGALAVKYDKLVPLLIEAVKDLTAQVAALQNQINNK